jgi:hypothetical protein
MDFPNSKKSLLAIGLVVFALIFSGQTAANSSVVTPITNLNFDAYGVGGSVSFAGGSTPLIGSDITVSDIYAVGGSDTSKYTITGGTLSFTTGNLISSTATSWTFAGGGSLNIAGTVFGSYSSDLLSGTLNSVLVTENPAGSFQFYVQSGALTGTFASQILSHYCLGNSTYPGASGLAFFGQNVVAGGGFQSLNGAFGQVGAAVPIPPSAMLLGSGLLGLVGFFGLRRKNAGE